MNQSHLKTAANFTSKRIAFIQASWHKDIVDQCRLSFAEEIVNLGFAENQVDFFAVPGVFEIPLQAQLLAKSGKYDCIVATGFIVNGGIYRHEFVSTAVIDGLMRVQLDCEVPIISAVLTPQNYHEHGEHQAFFMSHFKVKGREAASACAQTIVNRSDLVKKAA